MNHQTTEYHTRKRIDNSRLVRPSSPARLRDYWRRVAAGVGMASCLLFYAWQHFECIQIRYHIEQLNSQRIQASELNQQLHLEVATLRAPKRVDAIASRLGLTVPVPGQVPPPDGQGEPVLAQARGLSQTIRP
jgi:cell division protein FtsL